MDKPASLLPTAKCDATKGRSSEEWQINRTLLNKLYKVVAQNV